MDNTAMGIGLFAYLLVGERGRIRATGYQLREPLGWGLGILFALSNVLFVIALANAAVSDILGCLATASIFSALFFKERIGAATWVAAGIITVGLLLTAFGGGGSFGRLIGILTAVVFGATFVVMPATGEGDTIPSLALGGIFIAVTCVWPADILSLPPQAYTSIAGLAVILPVAFALIERGPRDLPAPEVSLLMLLETVFGTLWAWLWLNETPTTATLLAIALILGTLAAFHIHQARTMAASTS